MRSPCLCRDGKVSLPQANSCSLQRHPLFHSEFQRWIRSMAYGHWIPIVFKQEGCPLCETIVARQQLIFSAQATILPVEKNAPSLKQIILFCSQEALILFQATKTQKIHSDILKNGFRQIKSKQDNSSSLRNSQGEQEAGQGGWIGNGYL